MELQRIIEAGLMTHLLLFGGLIALICMVLSGAKKQTKYPVSFSSSRQMIGLYYQLESGANLFICKDSSDNGRLIANLIKALINRSAEASDVVDSNSFQQVCGETFNPTMLHTKLISLTTSVYPMYRNTGILVSSSDT